VKKCKKKVKKLNLSLKAFNFDGQLQRNVVFWPPTVFGRKMMPPLDFAFVIMLKVIQFLPFSEFSHRDQKP
jgi:hypothetical protein